MVNLIVWDCPKCGWRTQENICEKCGTQQGYSHDVGSGWFNLWTSRLPEDFWIDSGKIGPFGTKTLVPDEEKYEVQRLYPNETEWNDKHYISYMVYKVK